MLIINSSQQHYEPGSKARAGLDAAIEELRAGAPFEIGVIIDGEEVSRLRGL